MRNDKRCFITNVLCKPSQTRTAANTPHTHHTLHCQDTTQLCNAHYSMGYSVKLRDVAITHQPVQPLTTTASHVDAIGVVCVIYHIYNSRSEETCSSCLYIVIKCDQLHRCSRHTLCWAQPRAAAIETLVYYHVTLIGHTYHTIATLNTSQTNTYTHNKTHSSYLKVIIKCDQPHRCSCYTLCWACAIEYSVSLATLQTRH